MFTIAVLNVILYPIEIYRQKTYSTGEKADDSRGHTDWCTFPLNGRMAHHQLVCRTPHGAAAPSAYCEGSAGRKMGQGACLAPSPHPLVQRQGPCCQTGDGERWQEDPGGGGHTRQ